MQVKEKKLKIVKNKVTGIVGKSVDEIDLFCKSNIKEKLYKISFFETENIPDVKVKKFISNNLDNETELLKSLDFDIKDLDKNISELSTSEKIKILIIKSFFSNNIIYFDNILSFLDSSIKVKIFKFIKNVKDKTIIISDINIDNIFEIVNMLIIIDNNDYEYDDKYNIFLNNKFDYYKPITLLIKDKILDKKGINIDNTDSINELIKTIYREIR